MNKNIAIILLSITTIIGFGNSLIQSIEAENNRVLYEEQQQIAEIEKIRADSAALVANQQRMLAEKNMELVRKQEEIARREAKIQAKEREGIIKN